jgi:DNA modification methylase
MSERTNRKPQPVTVGPSHHEPQPLCTLDDLRFDPRNANKGTRRGRALLADSLRTHGAGRSILTDRHGCVIAGNKTLEQARVLDMPIRVIDTTGKELVVVRRNDLDLADDPRAKALAVADNRIAELDLDWDVDILRQLHDDGIDLQQLWSPDELEQLFGPRVVDGGIPEDAIVPLRKTSIRRGDLITCGEHHVLCGDATNPDDVHRLLDGADPSLLVTDPPYGVSYDPTWRPRAGRRGRHAVGAVTNDDRVDWRAAIELFSGDIAYVWHSGLHAGTVATVLTDLGFVLRAQIIWVKPHFVLGQGDFHWQHEPCFYAVRKGRPSRWRGDRTQSTVWQVPNLNPITGERGGENAVTGHATQKPVQLFERSILGHTSQGAAIYDPFLGSGTALIAAEKVQRRCLALEIEPTYVQAAVDRWEAYTGQTSRLQPRDAR